MPASKGLQRAGARLPIDDYSRRLWQRRYFIAAYATSTNAVGYEGSFLGQAWQLLTPLMNIAVYYLIFGYLLHTSRGVPNFIAFLTVGVFIFSFCSNSLVSGSRAITGNIELVRALQFPRAALPIASTLVLVLQLAYSMIVLVPILLLSGVRPSLHWLLLIPAVVLQSLFCLALALAAARLGARVPDTTQLLPFVARVWMYLSGLMYSIAVFTRHHSPWVRTLLTDNPGNVYLTLARSALLPASTATPHTWLLAAAWSIGALTLAYPYFWRGEETYGNV